MDNEQKLEKWSSMDTITDYLGVSRETVLQWINNRNMPAHKVGRLWKFKISEVDKWIRSGGAAENSSAEEAKDRE
jgi:excisionase family DNA binding protein